MEAVLVEQFGVQENLYNPGIFQNTYSKIENFV